MDNKIVLCLMYDTEKVTLDIVKEWCNTVCQCFEPEEMMCGEKSSRYDKDSMHEYLEKNIYNDRLALFLNNETNSFYITKNDTECRTFEFSVNLLVTQNIKLINSLIDKYMMKDGIVAYKCTAEDDFWQNAEKLVYYKAKKKSLEGKKFTTRKVGMKKPIMIVDVEYNPGHSHRYEGVWFGSCYQMWFGKPYYEFISKEKLQKFQNCYENVELGNDALRITLYEDIWDFDNPINRKRQWKFRRSVGMDKVAHALLKKPKKYRKSIDPQVEFENKIENGVEYHLVVNYADKNDKPIEKSRAAKKITYVYVKGENEPIDILKESI